MKKNLMMRAASVLLVAVMLTTCAISGTFAKYVTADDSTASARVAKFGVVVTGNENTMFGKSYTGNTYTPDGGAETNVTVEASTYVVAPGTSGELTNFTVTGTPEVAVRVSYDEGTTVDLGDKWVGKLGSYYCPIKVNVNGTVLCGLDYADVDAFEAAIKANIVGATKDYAPGTDLSTKVNDDLNISWSWAFTDSTDYLAGKQNDTDDTALGDAADAEINITVTCTVTQID